MLCLLALLLTPPAAAEELTLSTYYPSPRGVYRELRTTNNTYLAQLAGGVAIGTRVLDPVEQPLNREPASFVVAGVGQNPVGPACPAGLEFYNENASGGTPENGECKRTLLEAFGETPTSWHLRSTARRFELAPNDPGEGFWFRAGPDEGGTPINNPEGDNVIGWNQTPGFAGRQIYLFGTTRIGDPTQPYTTYDLLVSGKIAATNTIRPGTLAGDPLPAGDGEIYYNTSANPALQGLRVYQGGWRSVWAPQGTVTVPGWARFPNGLLMQWGRNAVTSCGTVKLPVDYSGVDNYVVLVNSDAESHQWATRLSAFQIELCNGGGTLDMDWLTIGK